MMATKAKPRILQRPTTREGAREYVIQSAFRWADTKCDDQVAALAAELELAWALDRLKEFDVRAVKE
jgi:hypothetical protein